MPSPEGEKRRPRGRDVPEQPNQPEREKAPYIRAASFAGEQSARRAYEQAQEAIYTGPPNEISVYRMQLDHVWHVAAVGEQPPEELDEKLTTIFATGMPATLPEEIRQYLLDRRREMKQLGPWVEGHYRPGKPVNRKPKRK